MSERLQVELLGNFTIANAGHTVGVDFRITGDPEPLRLDFRHETLPKLYVLLQSAGAAAAKERITSGAQAKDHVSEPFHILGSRVGIGEDHLAIRFRTKQRVPLEVAIPRDQVRKLASDLLAGLTLAPPRRQ